LRTGQLKRVGGIPGKITAFQYGLKIRPEA
jgi:hypothetical protein